MMAGSVNKVILVGNLGADPEIRKGASGVAVATFRLATSETWRDKNSGERKERTEWHTVVVFSENLVKLCEQYLKKGSKVYVEGQQKSRKYQDGNGQDRWVTETVLQNFRGEIQLLDKSPSNRAPGADDPDQYGSGDSRQQPAERQMSPGERDVDDEIPF
jgi:single-strand DNA-binding protein